jgi:hypothetical protein
MRPAKLKILVLVYHHLSHVRSLTITTFNILAPLHRTMTPDNNRESEREDWWRPRAVGVANYIKQQFSESDIILLQEWWFDDEFSAIFDTALGDNFERIAERRPGPKGENEEECTPRDDGMCCLIRRMGRLELIQSTSVQTGPQRIAQIVHCRERIKTTNPNNEATKTTPRDVFLANAHLSYPGLPDPVINDKRQESEVSIILSALCKAGIAWSANPNNDRLEAICGDFNSDSTGLASLLVESRGYANCASAYAEQNLHSGVGGMMNVGVTHKDHLGRSVSVDHIFVRSARGEGVSGPENSRRKDGSSFYALALGFLDTKGTRVLNVERGNIHLEGQAVLSDHRPVTAKIAWPPPPKTHTTKAGHDFTSWEDMYADATMPLDPLEPA